MQKIINETEKETEKYFNNIMELIGANIFLFLSGIPLDKESKDKITESFEQQIHVQSERKTKADYMKYWLEYIADNIQSMHNNDQNQLIQQIYKYLNDNFSQPIGLDKCFRTCKQKSLVYQSFYQTGYRKKIF